MLHWKQINQLLLCLPVLLPSFDLDLDLGNDEISRRIWILTENAYSPQWAWSSCHLTLFHPCLTWIQTPLLPLHSLCGGCWCSWSPQPVVLQILPGGPTGETIPSLPARRVSSSPGFRSISTESAAMNGSDYFNRNLTHSLNPLHALSWPFFQASFSHPDLWQLPAHHVDPQTHKIHKFPEQRK